MRGAILEDDKLAAAMIDRIAHHGKLIEFGGQVTAWTRR